MDQRPRIILRLLLSFLFRCHLCILLPLRVPFLHLCRSFLQPFLVPILFLLSFIHFPTLAILSVLIQLLLQFAYVPLVLCLQLVLGVQGVTVDRGERNGRALLLGYLVSHPVKTHRFEAPFIQLKGLQLSLQIVGREVIPKDHLHLRRKFGLLLGVYPIFVQELLHIIKAGIVHFKAAFVHATLQLRHGQLFVAERLKDVFVRVE